MRLAPGGQRVRFLKCGVALIVPGGYCLHVALHSWWVQSLGTSHRNNHISISPSLVRKDGTPSCQAWLIGGQKRRVTQSDNLHWCSSHYKFVSGGLGTQVPSVSVNGQPVPFPAPLQDYVSSLHQIGCTHLAEMSLSKARKLLWQENLSQGILWPVPLWGTPVSTPWALSPVVRSGNSCLDSNMAVLSP